MGAHNGHDRLSGGAQLAEAENCSSVQCDCT